MGCTAGAGLSLAVRASEVAGKARPQGASPAAHHQMKVLPYKCLHVAVPSPLCSTSLQAHLLGIPLPHLQRSMLPLHSRLAALQPCGEVSNLPPELHHQAIVPTLALGQQLCLHARI